jgi:hypothetical protein
VVPAPDTPERFPKVVQSFFIFKRDRMIFSTSFQELKLVTADAATGCRAFLPAKRIEMGFRERSVTQMKNPEELLAALSQRRQ